jgi:hypothetical protein
MKTTLVRLITTTAVIASMSAFGPAAHAAHGSHGPRVMKSGSCSGSSHWKLKLKTEDTGIEVEFEVDQNVSGQAWRVRLAENGTQIASGRRTTRGPSGSFTFIKLAHDAPGRDAFVARATNVHSGETCVGRASI